MRISDWSSDVCSSDLRWDERTRVMAMGAFAAISAAMAVAAGAFGAHGASGPQEAEWLRTGGVYQLVHAVAALAIMGFARGPAIMLLAGAAIFRSEEHTSELQSLMRISYAVFCLKKKKHKNSN